ncbi:MAG: IPT/TIG domain-containing protein [Candidatus Coatesbacteria bacterium]
MATVVEYGPKKGKAGLPVNIIGDGFSVLTNVRVRFGSLEVAAPLTVVKNDQHVKAEVPSLPDGPVALVLVADEIPDGLFVGGFTVGTVPEGTAVTDVYPDVLDPNLPTDVRIFGYGFRDVGAAGAVSVMFGSSTVQGTAVDSTLIVATAPPRPPRGTQCFNVTATFVDGTQAVAAELTCYT